MLQTTVSAKSRQAESAENADGIIKIGFAHMIIYDADKLYPP